MWPNPRIWSHLLRKCLMENFIFLCKVSSEFTCESLLRNANDWEFKEWEILINEWINNVYKSANVLITQKPVSWFAEQMNWLVSIWWEHWSLKIKCPRIILHKARWKDEDLLQSLSYHLFRKLSFCNRKV